MSNALNTHHNGVSEDYFKKRELKKGAAGWVLLAFLGVAYVISGDFAGWNFGIKNGGWGGLMVATVLMAVMYFAMVLAEAELSTMIPTAGGGYGFARRAFGPLGGYVTGTAILMEYAIAPAAIAVFIGGYCGSLFGAEGSLIGYVPEGLRGLVMFLLGNTWATKFIFYAIFVGVHLWGVGEALKLCMVITVIASIALLIFVLAMVPYFDAKNLFDIPPQEGVAGANAFLPFGWLGIWAAIPYGIWFFLGVEGVPLAAEEANDPKTDLPRGIIWAMLILLVFAAVILVFGPGGSSALRISNLNDPLVGALQDPNAYTQPTMVSRLVNVVGLTGLIASFFSLIFGASRQFFALSRAGYLPRILSLTGSRKTPWLALMIIGGGGFLLSLTGEGDLLILVAVFGATISYVMMTASHLMLRIKEPNLERHYRTPGGMLTSGIGLALGIVAFIAGFLVNLTVVFYAAGIYAVMLLYFLLYSRHHLVAQAPEEEFEAIAHAQEELS
jgi:ethanolamine permease